MLYSTFKSKSMTFYGRHIYIILHSLPFTNSIPTEYSFDGGTRNSTSSSSLKLVSPLFIKGCSSPIFFGMGEYLIYPTRWEGRMKRASTSWPWMFLGRKTITNKLQPLARASDQSLSSLKYTECQARLNSDKYKFGKSLLWLVWS